MAATLAKYELLEKLKPDLQCYKCKDLPGPHRDQRKRYSCIDASHLLCEKDKAKCPCGSFVGTKPSTIIDKLLEGFPYKMCDNYAAGCRVIKMSAEDFQKHQKNCPFRQVFCPVLSCKEKEVLSQDIITHLKSIHNYDFENILCLANFQEYVLTTYNLNFGTLKRGNTSIGWKKTLSFDGALFFFVGKVIDNILYLWIYYFGEPNDATKYSCVINAYNKIGESFHYTGTVHALDEEDNEIIASQSLLMLGVSAATKDLFDEKVQLKIVVTIEKVGDGEVAGTTAIHNEEEPRRQSLGCFLDSLMFLGLWSPPEDRSERA